jgi:hypothetical protein
MRRYKTIALSILITLAALGVAFVATRNTQGYSTTDKKTLKVLRKKDHLGLKPTPQEIAAQLPQVERELIDNLPKHLPLKIKVKNLKSEKWVRDFALEITNTSDKPIYYLYINISLPDVITENNRNLGFPLRYGRGALTSFAVPLEPDDVPIKPGETYTLQIPEQLQQGWERFVARRGISKDEPKKIKFIFQVLNFGDGTGFRAPSGVPFDIHKRRREIERGNGAAAISPNKPPSRSSLNLPSESTLFLPAKFSPVKFYPASVPAFAATASSGDICCPGSSCQSLRYETVYCCAEIQKAVNSPCSDTNGYCTNYTTQDVSCNDEFGTYCIEDILGDPCPPPGATPTPTPNATPTPTPSPTPSPTPTPQCPEDCTRCNPDGYCETNFPPAPFCAGPFCPYGPTADTCAYPQTGCPGNAYYAGGGCCQCVNQNPTCASGFTWDTDRCECVPAPTPTPAPGGGGGGGDAYYCSHYYWVYYESYDGGETWREVDREYAGCW